MILFLYFPLNQIQIQFFSSMMDTFCVGSLHTPDLQPFWRSQTISSRSQVSWRKLQVCRCEQIRWVFAKQDWLVVWNHGILNDFPYIGNVIIPTDEVIFFRGVGQPPTRKVGIRKDKKFFCTKIQFMKWDLNRKEGLRHM